VRRPTPTYAQKAIAPPQPSANRPPANPFLGDGTAGTFNDKPVIYPFKSSFRGYAYQVGKGVALEVLRPRGEEREKGVGVPKVSLTKERGRAPEKGDPPTQVRQIASEYSHMQNQPEPPARKITQGGGGTAPPYIL
jgi:hypothetical protein